MTIKTKEILIEQRKRYQAYKTLDYIISTNTCFDFFTRDTINIILYAIYLFEKLKFSKFSLNCFLLSSVEKSTIMNTLLKDEIRYISKKINKIINKEIEVKTFLQNIKNKIYKLNNKKEHTILLNLNSESQTITQFISKLVDNCFTRFKTLVVSEEVFLITLFEELQKSKDSRFFKNFYVTRYKLLKELHAKEYFIKRVSSRNFIYFAYLLKTQLTSVKYNSAFNMPVYKKVILLFRNKLILNTLKFNLNKALKNEIYFTLLNN